MNHRELFLKHIAQTSPSPLAFEISRAEGCLLYDANGKEYIDLIGGISVANTGHRHPKVLEAIRTQLNKYLHVMVYGEFIESPQVLYAKFLTDHLPSSLNTVYFTNSGTEAVEGAMKLAKRFTGRTGIIAFKNSYHGSTQGSLSIIGDEEMRNSFRPLLPGILHLEYNSMESLDAVDNNIACVIVETIQGEAGVIAPSQTWMQLLRSRCTEQNVLLIVDEIQAGFGRTGSLWGFSQFEFIPDVLLLGKALGGGLPLGAFISTKEIMVTLTNDPVLGHITTFGGHPLCCAAGMAAMRILIDEHLIESVKDKEALFKSLLVHSKIRSIRSFGLWMAIEFDSFETNKRVVDRCLDNGVLADWFLFNPQSLRISPPLTISTGEIKEGCAIILSAMGD